MTTWTPATLIANCDRDGDCLLWRGSAAKGAPYCCHEGRTTRARRLLLDLLGEPTEGLSIRASCGNSRCMARSHFLLLTKREQCSLAGSDRGKFEPDQEWMKKRRARAKIGIAGARMVLTSKESADVLAARLGVSATAVRSVRQGLNYTDAIVRRPAKPEGLPAGHRSVIDSSQCRPWAAVAAQLIGARA